MAKRTRSEMTIHSGGLSLRLVSETYEEDEAPSLPGITIDTTATDAEEPTSPRAVVKCQPAERKRVAS